MPRTARNVGMKQPSDQVYDPLMSMVEPQTAPVKKTHDKHSAAVVTQQTLARVDPLDLFLNFSGSKLVTITPNIAKHILENCNTLNRPLNKKRVVLLADAIKNGEWQINGETIIFSKAKRLLDGQYRLSAILTANKEVETYVTTDVDEDAFETIDTGKSRSGSHVLSIKRTKYSFAVAATLNKVNRYINKNYDFDGAGVLSNRQLLHLSQQHSDVSKSVERFIKHSREISKSTLSFCHYILNKIDSTLSDTLFTQLIEANPTVPIVAVLKKHIAKNKNARMNHRLKQTAVIGAIFKTWNAMRTDTHTNNVAMHVTDEFPVPQ